MLAWTPTDRARLTALALLAAPIACAGSTGESGSESASASDTTSETATATEGSATEGSATMSASGTTASGGASNSASSGSTSETSTTSQVSDSNGSDATVGTTEATGTTSLGTTTDSTSDATSDSTTDTSTDGTTDGTTAGTTTDDTTTTGPDCVPAEEVCNEIDDDCDGLIDNVDVGMDGICDCLSIALVGNEGANPSAEFQAWLEAQGTQVDRINTNPNEPLDKATLEQYDIIILDWLVRSYTAEEAAATKAWIEAGGGLMSMTGHTNSQSVADRPNSLIQPMGLSYNTSKGFFSGPITTFTDHPINVGLSSISFFGGLYVDIVEDGVGVNEAIMTLPQGPVGVAQDRENGSLFIFGDEWVEFDSEWKNIPQIKQFWVQVLAYIGPKEFCLLPQ